MKSVNFIIPLVVYPFDIMFSFGQDDNDLFNDLDNHGVYETEWELAECNGLTVEGRCVMFSGNQTLVRIRKIPKSACDFRIIQHEIFHAVSFILHRLGVELKIGVSDEVYAYLIGYVTEQVYEKISNKKQK